VIDVSVMLMAEELSARAFRGILPFLVSLRLTEPFLTDGALARDLKQREQKLVTISFFRKFSSIPMEASTMDSLNWGRNPQTSL
jgi:hypothetical protein